jgi:hypothetical protein
MNGIPRIFSSNVPFNDGNSKFFKFVAFAIAMLPLFENLFRRFLVEKCDTESWRGPLPSYKGRGTPFRLVPEWHIDWVLDIGDEICLHFPLGLGLSLSQGGLFSLRLAKQSTVKSVVPLISLQTEETCSL